MDTVVRTTFMKIKLSEHEEIISIAQLQTAAICQQFGEVEINEGNRYFEKKHMDWRIVQIIRIRRRR